MRLMGISPGKLKLPCVQISPFTHTHGPGFATVVIALPNFKQYIRQRTIHYSLPDGGSASPHGQQIWEECSLAIVRGHPDLDDLFGGEMIQNWLRRAEKSCFEDDPLQL